MSVPITTRRFTVEEYHRMAEAGILREDDRVELLDGEIVQMTPIGPRHAGCVKDPGRSGYRDVRTARRGGTVTPLHLPDIAIPVDEILG